MDFKPKNREWVKNAAIVFLSVMLLLTFFSNTIMNRTLAEVATQYVTDGTITAKVRGTGIVTANGSHQVKAEQTREIRAVMIKAGQEVEAGDVLFILGQGDSEELEAAQEQLRQLQLSYQRAAINMPTFNYGADQRKVDAAKRAMEDAEAAMKQAEQKMNSALAGTSTKEELDAAKKELDDANKNLEDIKDKFNQAKKNLLDDITYVRGLLESVEDQFENSSPTTPENPGGDGSGTGGDGSDTGSDGSGTGGDGSDTGSDGSGTGGDGSGTGGEDGAGGSGEGGAETVAYKASGSKGLLATALVSTDKPRIATALAAEDFKTPTTKQEYDALKQKLSDMETELSLMNGTDDPAIVTATAIRDRAQEKYDAMLSVAGPETEAYNKAKAEAEAATEAYLSAVESLNQKKDSDNKSQALASIDLSDLAVQMEKQREKIKELSGGEENQICANVSGIVQTVECTAGDVAPADQVLCTIEVPDMGYSLSFSVTNDQARRLRPGDSATVSNYYWGSEIIASLSTIKVDPKQPQTNKLLTFDLTGDVTAGSELSISVGQKSARYDVIIPNSSIRSDTNGSFVLKIEAKNSPLGNRYIARRVDVEVLASDDMNSAVTGDLGYGDYVITTSNAPVNNGDMVKMADN